MNAGASALGPRGDRRAEIVRVAYQLIAERGLEGLRFADVARGAGINNGTLLYYFASKDALVQAVGAFLVDEFSRTAVRAPEEAPQDAITELRNEFVDAGQRLGSQLGVVYTELLARAQRDAAVAALMRGIDAAWRGWLRQIIERGRCQQLFRADLDVELVVTTIMASIRGVGVQALVARDSATLGPAMQTLAALIERWIVAAP